MSKTKIAVSSLIFGGVAWAAFSTPIPWYHEAPCFLEPQNVVTVSAPVNGMILAPEEYAELYNELLLFQNQARTWAVEIPTPGKPGKLLINPATLDLLKGLPGPAEYTRIRRNGESVSANDVIVILESPEDLRRHDELLQHVRNWVFRTEEINQYKINKDPAGEGVAIAEALELEQQIQKTVRLNLQRVVRATISGTIVAAKRVPDPPRNEVDAMKLGRWTGTPLDPENAGCLLDAGQEIASLAPSEKLHAVMYIDQGDRDDLEDEMPLEIKLDHLADITFLTRVGLISPKGEVMAPESLTTRYHGPLATKANQQGQEQLASTAYRAIAELHFSEDTKPEANLLKPGMRGNGRFIISNRTAAYWLWRYVCETFRFRVYVDRQLKIYLGHVADVASVRSGKFFSAARLDSGFRPFPNVRGM